MATQKCHRDGDSNSGGGVVSSSGTVYVNGKPITTDGDAVSGHGRGRHSAPVTANGSGTVRALGGQPVNRQGDADTCGHARSGGSSDVYVG